jgi:DNA polymerase III subunit delta'
MARAPALQELEAVPEADRLGEFLHPRATKTLYGHEAAEQAFVEAVASGRMHHGWLLSGREGIGKATLAYRVARHLLADKSERDAFGASLAVAEETTAARQVLALSHPGLLVLRRPYDHKAKRFTASIPVDEVRRLKGFLAHSADHDAYRVVIVDSADELNPNAANALLKSLEEPPARTVFLLISSEPGRLLPTIRSRCRTMTLPPLGVEDLRRAVHAAVAAADVEPPGPQDWDKLVALSEGSVRQALTVASSGGLKLFGRVHALVSGLPKVDWATVHTLGDDLAGTAATDNFVAFFDLLQGMLARMIRAAATNTGAPADLALAARLISPPSVAAWAEVWEALTQDTPEVLLLNLDRKAHILLIAAKLEAVSAR